jgi:hypothetical protein
MRYNRESKNVLNVLHVSDIFDELAVVLVPIILEQNKDKKLMPGVDLL